MRYVPALMMAMIICMMMLIGALYVDPDAEPTSPKSVITEAPKQNSPQAIRPLDPHEIWNEEPAHLGTD